MSNKDFEIFKKECRWFIKQTDNVEFAEPSFEYSDTFRKTFPTLHKLLCKARVLGIILKRMENKKETTYNYRLFSWDRKDETTFGWLCRIDTDSSSIEILLEHQLLLDNLGGIQESYMVDTDDDTEKLTDNQNFLFIKSECEKGMDEDWKSYYYYICEEENVQPIEMEDFICFAIEANGNKTYYDLKSKKVFLFAPDHCFDNVIEVEGQPELTFYTIDKIETFVDYVEQLAQQWLEDIG